MYTTRKTCRVCGSKNLTDLFSLGDQYVSDFVDKEHIHSGQKVPIDIQLCGRCTLVQAKHTAPQDFLYSRHYWYRSGVTATMRQSLYELACDCRQYLNPGDTVLDIGSNDGTFLRYFHLDNVTTVGVEPATNLAEEGAQDVAFFVNDFWSAKIYNDLHIPKPKLITALGMFYDLEDPNQFIADIASTLAPDGVFISQLMCLYDTIEKKDIGNFAHEHLEFYTLRSLQFLFRRHGLTIYDIQRNNVNGGSYRVFAKHIGSAYGDSESFARVRDIQYMERKLGDGDNYKQFYQSLCENRDKTAGFIKEITRQGQTVYAYGASTKGNVILQFCELDHTLVTAAAERSPEKYGKYTIGSGIPIVSEAAARTASPDCFLILPYAFLPEFIAREEDYLSLGGKFIVPLPRMRVI